MDSITGSHWYDYKDQFFRINPTKSGISTRILRPLLDQLLAISSYHNKIFVWRFDIRLYENSDDSKIISIFNRMLFKRLKRKYKFNRIAYFWVREQEQAKQQHYHYVLMLDGNKVNSQHNLREMVNIITCNLNLSVYFCDQHFIKRGDKTAFDNATHHISYLAKARGKGYRPPQSKDYGGSRLKMKTTV